jgi:hypothetical protein
MRRAVLWIIFTVLFIGLVVALLFTLNSFAKQEVKVLISGYLQSTLSLKEAPDVEVRGRFNIFRGYSDEVDIFIGSLEYGGFSFQEVSIELRELKFNLFEVLLNPGEAEVAVSKIKMETTISQDELNSFFSSRFPGLSIRLSAGEVIASGILQILGRKLNFELTGIMEISGENSITLNPRNVSVDGYELSGEALNTVLNSLSYDINFGQLPLGVKISRIFIYEGFVTVLWESEGLRIKAW